MMATMKRGATLLVDELDASLHPMIIMSFIKIFHNDEINKNGAQLIFNTHNPLYLQKKFFRRDQIMFVEKDETTTIEYTNNYEENKIETKENKSDQTPKQESKKAKTGDDTQILENLMLLISSLGGILFGLRFYRRKNEF